MRTAWSGNGQSGCSARTWIRNASAIASLSAPSSSCEHPSHVIRVDRVTDANLDDWLSFFDHDAFVGNPAWAACYCLEPHVRERGVPPDQEPDPSWQDNRTAMQELLRSGRSHGYLAYVDGRPAGWVNASLRSEYALHRAGTGAEPPDGDVVGVSCFVVAPPYRRHGLASHLLDRVLADAPQRGVDWIEAYPSKADDGDDAGNFRGPRAMYDERGFEPVAERERDVVIRRRVA